jgi:hypothetical protein
MEVFTVVQDCGRTVDTILLPYAKYIPVAKTPLQPMCIPLNSDTRLSCALRQPKFAR